MDARSRRVPSVFDDSASIWSRAQYGPDSHRLRPAESRFSLRDQFASTRREYEFGFDDASSFLERSTLASEAIQGEDIDDADDTVLVEGNSPVLSPGHRDCYELLCLPRGTPLSPEQVRDAAHCLVQVLNVYRQPPALLASAAYYLGLTQAALETLVEPSRRLGYDLSGVDVDESASDCDEAIADEQRLTNPEINGSYDTKIQEQYLLLTERESRATADLGLRFDATSLLAPQHSSRRLGSGADVLDVSLRKSTTTSVPALRSPLETAALFIQRVSRKAAAKAGPAHFLRLRDPTVTITASTHGLLDEPYRLAPILRGHYQPPGPSLHGRRRMEQLVASRFLPGLSLNLRQEVFRHAQPFPRALPDLVVEQELEVLPQPSTTTRIGHSINLPGNDGPLNVEISAQKLLTRRSSLSPNLGLAVHQRVGPGTAFLVADGGDWNLRTSKECRELTGFSKVSGGLGPMMDAFRNPPTVELGYAFGRHDMGMQSGQAFTKPAERGLRGLDCDLDENKPSSWTVSTGMTPGNAAIYLRYGRDFFSSRTTRPSSPSRQTPTGFRAEAELAATTQRDFSLAFRALKRIGRFSKAGLEVSLSATNLHLSLYWSRLGQRITLPFLIAPTTTTTHPKLPIGAGTKLLLWTTLLPFTLLTAREIYRHHQRAKAKALTAATTTGTSLPHTKQIQIQSQINRHRAEADTLTTILAHQTQSRQDARRRRGGLVILSAKYGERGAPPEEVADVTIAVAALVQDSHDDDDLEQHDSGGGTLVIPAGLRKGRLLGFWDPAPLKKKVLRVRYLWKGRELAVEVGGREEVRLP